VEFPDQTSTEPIESNATVETGADASTPDDSVTAARLLAEYHDANEDAAPAPVANTVAANTAVANSTVTSANTVVADTTTANTASANTVLDPDDFANVPANNARGGENRIPYSAVSRMVEKAKATAAAEFEPRFADYETERQGFAQFEHAIMANPDAVMNLLARTNPTGFAKYLQSQQQQQPTTQNTHAQVPNNQDIEPEPDLDYGNGRLGYSADQLRRRDAWRDRQLESRIAQRFAPIEQREQQARAEAVRAQQEQAIRTDYTEVAALPGFEEHKKEIEALFAKPTASSWSRSSKRRHVSER
jgi:hypothetical protein